MAEDSDTLTVRMLRKSGRSEDRQWLEYRPAFNVPVVRISWELNTMDVELDTPIAEYLLKAGYAAPLPQGSAPKAATPPAPSAPAPAPQQVAPQKPDTETAETPPPAPSWLKNAGG